MKGNAGIFIIIGILIVVFIGVLISRGYLTVQESPESSPSPQSLSDDPKYKEVKDKYNLSEEQLQILSTVNPNDNN
jgi:hypothetical protein